MKNYETKIIYEFERSAFFNYSYSLICIRREAKTRFFSLRKVVTWHDFYGPGFIAFKIR